jgi:hypothetical protein
MTHCSCLHGCTSYYILNTKLQATKTLHQRILLDSKSNHKDCMICPPLALTLAYTVFSLPFAYRLRPCVLCFTALIFHLPHPKYVDPVFFPASTSVLRMPLSVKVVNLGEPRALCPPVPRALRPRPRSPLGRPGACLPPSLPRKWSPASPHVSLILFFPRVCHSQRFRATSRVPS